MILYDKRLNCGRVPWNELGFLQVPFHQHLPEAYPGFLQTSMNAEVDLGLLQHLRWSAL